MSLSAGVVGVSLLVSPSTVVAGVSLTVSSFSGLVGGACVSGRRRREAAFAMAVYCMYVMMV